MYTNYKFYSVQSSYKAPFVSRRAMQEQFDWQKLDDFYRRKDIPSKKNGEGNIFLGGPTMKVKGILEKFTNG